MNNAGDTSRRFSRSIVVSLSLFALFAVGIWGALAAVGWESAAGVASHLHFSQILALIAVSSLHYVLRAVRWHILARTAGMPTNLVQNLLHYFGGIAMVATPGRLGEFVRLRWMCGETGWPVERAASIVVADRAIELAGMIAVILYCILASSVSNAGIFLVLLFAFLLVSISLNPRLLSGMVLMTWRGVGRFPRTFVRLRRLSQSLKTFVRPRVLIPTTVISAAGWLLEGYAFFLLLQWMAAEIDLFAATVAFLTGVLSGALSGLPGGLGGTELAIVGILAHQDIPIEVALVATAIIRVTTLWYAVAIGAIFFPLAELQLRAARRRDTYSA